MKLNKTECCEKDKNNVDKSSFVTRLYSLNLKKTELYVSQHFRH